MKRKIIGIFIITLLITTTVIPVIGVMNEKEISTSSLGGLFIQTPEIVDWYETFSNSDRTVYEDFWGITSPICSVKWWGEFWRFYNNNWNGPYTPEERSFNITFYEDNNGEPGEIVSSYNNILPSYAKSGVFITDPSGYSTELYFFEYNLEPCCELSNGWISIESVSQDGEISFLIINSPDGNNKHYRYEYGYMVPKDFNQAFALCDGEIVNPDLECEGTITWNDVTPDDNVISQFSIRNNGDAGSILHWNISSFPDWGNWTFTPSSGVLTPEKGWVSINVKVNAPNEKKKEFSGKITIINTFDSSDTYQIDVSLSTPKYRLNLNPFLLRFINDYNYFLPNLRNLLEM